MLFNGFNSLQAQPPSLPQVIDSVQPKMVKIFGGGGFRRLESWQSGFLISNDGLLVTVWSYVLDTETTVVFDDGLRLNAKLVGHHPQFEIALLRVDIQDHPHFNLDAASKPLVGSTALAFSNLYGIASGNEQCSVQTGVVSAVLPLNARRGSRRTSYHGPAIILDAITNNPGAAGGAVTDRQGILLGMIGRESRSIESNLWLNYSIPAEQISLAVDLILANRSGEKHVDSKLPMEHLTLEMTGIVLVPNVVDRTPSFVDQVIRGSAADLAGILTDDLIIEVAGEITASRKALIKRLQEIDRDASVEIMLQRDEKFLNVTLRVSGR